MTGWWLGWLIVPDEPVEALDNLHVNLALCPPAVVSTLSDHTDDSEL
ncbi:hypothetical protein FRC0547_02099 [Corynebacterium diphtheriae]|nr:hypothetical protein FRC0515_02034 [Corynebacterium diphtheriae]CAB1048041.1 hypothetical protein FRC0547_02099 [Corynebacterium diphtheriae]